MRTNPIIYLSSDKLVGHDKVLEFFKGKPTDICESEDKTRLLFVGYSLTRDFQALVDAQTKKLLFSEKGNTCFNMRKYCSVGNMLFREINLNSFINSFHKKVTMIGSELSLFLTKKSVDNGSQSRFIKVSYVRVLYLKNKLVKLLT